MKIGNVNNLPWYARLGLFGVGAVLIYAGFWYFVTSGTRKETKALQDQIATLQKANMEMQVASQRLNEFRATYKNKQEELEELKALLPEQRELTNVLQGIQDRAKTSGLSVRHFTPKDDVQQDFYSGKKIDVAVQSSFSSLRAFFDQLAHYQRIVSITNFEIKQLDAQGLLCVGRKPAEGSDQARCVSCRFAGGRHSARARPGKQPRRRYPASRATGRQNGSRSGRKIVSATY